MIERLLVYRKRTKTRNSLNIVIFCSIGAIAGLLAGLFGIGGGLVTIPLLIYAFGYLKIQSESLMHLVIGTSLCAMIFNTASSSISHIRKKAVSFHSLKFVLPGVVIGAFLGVNIAKHISSIALEKIFGTFECLVGLYYLSGFHVESKSHMPRAFGSLLIGLFFSSIAGIMGIGGGMFFVPIFHYFKLPFKNSIATASVISFSITLTAALTYLFSGIQVTTHISFTYLYLPAFLTIGVTTVFFAPVGAHLAHVINTKFLKKAFGVLLIVAGFTLIS